MKNGLAIVDSGPIISLALVDKLWILDEVFDKVVIPKAVWDEVTIDSSKPFVPAIQKYFKTKTIPIKGFNELTFVLDYGESESIILYRETQADFLLIDDKKARSIAENFGIVCIGTIGILSVCKDKKLIKNLKPIFESFIQNKRYYSIELLNDILIVKNEKPFLL